MAKVVITFQDGDNEQLISYYSDRETDLNDDLNKMTSAEQLAAIAIQLLDEYVSKAGANVERPLPKGQNQRLN
jgi:hypothetical protein